MIQYAVIFTPEAQEQELLELSFPGADRPIRLVDFEAGSASADATASGALASF